MPEEIRFAITSEDAREILDVLMENDLQWIVDDIKKAIRSGVPEQEGKKSSTKGRVRPYGPEEQLELVITAIAHVFGGSILCWEHARDSSKLVGARGSSTLDLRLLDEDSRPLHPFQPQYRRHLEELYSLLERLWPKNRGHFASRFPRSV